MSDYKILIWYIVTACIIFALAWIRTRLKIQRINREIADEHSRPSNWL